MISKRLSSGRLVRVAAVIVELEDKHATTNIGESVCDSAGVEFSNSGLTFLETSSFARALAAQLELTGDESHELGAWLKSLRLEET